MTTFLDISRDDGACLANRSEGLMLASPSAIGKTMKTSMKRYCGREWGWEGEKSSMDERLRDWGEMEEGEMEEKRFNAPRHCPYLSLGRKGG